MSLLTRIFGFDVLISALILIFAYAWMPLIDPDYFWHLKNGQVIHDTGAIFTQELFSHTAKGTPLIVTDWLFDWLLANVSRLFGDPGVRALVALFALATWQVMFRLARLYMISTEKAALLALAGFAFVTPALAPRPNLFTHLAFAYVLWTLLAFLRDRSMYRLATLIPLFALWANMHYGFASGLVLIALFVFSAITDRLWPLAADAPLASLLDFKVTVVFALCAVAAALNPIGPSIYPELLKLTARAAQSTVTEWSSPDFKTVYGRLTLVFLSLYLVGHVRSPQVHTWLRVWVPLFMLAGYLSSLRNGPFLGIAVTGFAAMLFHNRGSGQRPPGGHDQPTASAVAGFLHLVLIAIALVAANFGAPLIQAKYRQFSDDFLPIAATDFMLANVPAGRLFNSYDSGGYLLYRASPDYPVFIDGRYNPYSEAIHRAHEVILKATPGTLQVMRDYDIEIALIPSQAAISELLAFTNEYRPVYADAKFMIYVRNVHKFSAVRTLKKQVD